jgi:hypothetical protein
MMWLAVGGAVIALLLGVAIATAIGRRLPLDHLTASRAHYSQSPEKIWSAITNLLDAPNWRSGLRQVERLADRDGKQVWVEVGRSGRMPLVFEVSEPPRRLVTRIEGDELPFGGSWTFAIEPDGQGSTLTITEDGHIYRPFFRFMARYVFGYDGTLKRYLRDLGKKFGEKVQPVRVR